jgi:hypothetical protein
MYPDIYGKDMPRNFLRIALYHVRAANDIEIEYNSERDGWVIYMTATTGYKESENALKPIEERREKAFIPAWDDDEAG